MTDLIVILIVVAIILLALRSSMKHFRGEGDCCGGGTYKARRKKLSAVSCKCTMKVEGMTCQHCVNRVMEAVNAIDGASAVVRLKRGIVEVSMEKEISREILRETVEKAGYPVKEIK